jgi:hypothetical protein
VGTPRPYATVQPIAGVLAASPALLAAAADRVAAEIAPLASASARTDWRHTDFYRAEMGGELWRQFVAFDTRIDPTELAALKRRTNAIEDHFVGPGGRRVNLDPGYLDLARVVLATTKDAAHRIAIGEGIFAEATLRFVDGRFAPWPYTYPDYADPAALEFFTAVRARFRAEVRQRS